MEEPLIPDTELVNFLLHGCGGNTEPVSQSQAYRDIGMINRLVGNIQLAAKAWYRYMIVEGGKRLLIWQWTKKMQRELLLHWIK